MRFFSLRDAFSRWLNSSSTRSPMPYPESESLAATSESTMQAEPQAGNALPLQLLRRLDSRLRVLHILGEEVREGTQGNLERAERSTSEPFALAGGPFTSFLPLLRGLSTMLTLLASLDSVIDASVLFTERKRTDFDLCINAHVGYLE